MKVEPRDLVGLIAIAVSIGSAIFTWIYQKRTKRLEVAFSKCMALINQIGDLEALFAFANTRPHDQWEQRTGSSSKDLRRLSSHRGIDRRPALPCNALGESVVLQHSTGTHCNARIHHGHAKQTRRELLGRLRHSCAKGEEQRAVCQDKRLSIINDYPAAMVRRFEGRSGK